MRKWIAPVTVVAAIAALLFIGYTLLGGLIGIFNSAGTSGEPDPMFAEPLEIVTRPPENDGEGETPQDMSANWVYEETAPVDVTADMLASGS